MNEIEVILVKAWKLALQQGNTKLAEAIVSLPGLFISHPHTTETIKRDGFRIPSGKYRGQFLENLTDSDLKNVWSGFNGCGNMVVANILRTEMHRRGRN